MRSNHSREERQKIVEEYMQSGRVENQCPEVSDEDVAQALEDDDLFDRKSEKKKPGRTNNKSKNLARRRFDLDLTEHLFNTFSLVCNKHSIRLSIHGLY